GYLLGICNGFQILTKLGLLPEGSLINNVSGRFICRWVKLERRVDDNAFLRGLPENFELPIAHAEGRFVAPEGAAEKYIDEGLAALVYGEDVNGSTSRIAGLTDRSGRVLGLMPHPERFLWASHHYDRDWVGDGDGKGFGYQMFKSIYTTIAGEMAHEPG
ncbi:phosphoribosylformylglycinamidine synthase subunit PurQ, partial [Verrucomicrobiales bacterium]|nr:phosphoribosylformylglycinamidine synthase subunit PurQ [Verrucomicrobiales bacterium]